MVYRRVQSGAWIRLAPKVYALASAPPKWERQVAAAVLSRPRALVSGSSAAYLHGLDGFRPGRPEITVPAGSKIRSPLARIVSSIWFDELGTVSRSGFSVTDLAETMLALAGSLQSDRTESLLDDLLAGQRLVVDDFEQIRRRIQGARVRGSAILAPLLDDRAADAWEPSGNVLEGYLDKLVDHPDVPPAHRQVPLGFETVNAVVDRFIHRWQLILEADGRRWHTRRADFERDRARDNAAAAAGIAVLRFTWRMLTDDLNGCQRLLLQTGARRPQSA